jgi:hypothetical protein
MTMIAIKIETLILKMDSDGLKIFVRYAYGVRSCLTCVPKLFFLHDNIRYKKKCNTSVGESLKNHENNYQAPSISVKYMRKRRKYFKMHFKI